jgi:hypothetical protein
LCRISVISARAIAVILTSIAGPEENKLQEHVQEGKRKWVEIIHNKFEFYQIS